MHALLQPHALALSACPQRARRRRGASSGVIAEPSSSRGAVSFARIQETPEPSGRDTSHERVSRDARTVVGGLGVALSALLFTGSAHAFTKIDLTDIRSTVVDCPSAHDASRAAEGSTLIHCIRDSAQSCASHHAFRTWSQIGHLLCISDTIYRLCLSPESNWMLTVRRSSPVHLVVRRGLDDDDDGQTNLSQNHRYVRICQSLESEAALCCEEASLVNSLHDKRLIVTIIFLLQPLRTTHRKARSRTSTSLAEYSTARGRTPSTGCACHQHNIQPRSDPSFNFGLMRLSM